jgi:hypothetical protein
MHTDPTLRLLDDVTVDIGRQFRKFNNQTCPAFNTRELRREAAARMRRAHKRGGAQTGNASSASAPIEGAPPIEDEKRSKKFNLQTYKFHSLGDYADTIRRYGTTDSYSTERVRVFSVMALTAGDSQRLL